ncbi:MAG: tRNA (adenosine(37)-N6)-threonylcarbamoyltransferase complex ATPase subunit type 1 TsaE, partial [Fuerstiella sp.]|nr:tRNA (adenosine(37)-N6)-threonylcarbamoyltransferase complex ATPase subunit type 1 TsaE [Fuerstiella sp.]
MTSHVIFQSQSEDETLHLGQQIGRLLSSGLTIAMDGQLGSGKTQLARAICLGLEIHDELVNSPTFVLMQSYPGGRLPVCHFDTYQLGDMDEFLAIGAEDYLNDENIVCLIEWAELVQPVLPKDHLSIRILQTGEESREFQVSSGGPLSGTVLKQ